MEHHKISDTAREKYEDAVVGVFMEQYAATLDTGIRAELEECRDMEFPPELDRRCMELIRQTYVKKKKQDRYRAFWHGCRNAAILVVVLLTACSILLVSVEAFRTSVRNFFIENTDWYMRLTGQANENEIPVIFNEEDPLCEIIPGEFSLLSTDGGWNEACYTATYMNEDGAMFFLEILVSEGTVQIDSEGATIQEIEVQGHDAKVFAENNLVQVVWLDENVEKIFILSATNVTEEGMATYAERLAMLFD